MKKLYDEKLRFNTSYETISPKYKPSLLIVFLGTNDFIIVNNYYGCVAYGSRNFDFKNDTSIYKYTLKCVSVSVSSVEKIIKKYEYKRLKRIGKSIIYEVASDETE